MVISAAISCAAPWVTPSTSSSPPQAITSGCSEPGWLVSLRSCSASLSRSVGPLPSASRKQRPPENPVSHGRLACFMQVLLNCRADSLIMIHDFSSRQQYHIVRNVAREIATAEDLSVFAPILGRSHRDARAILKQHRFTPD